MFKYQDTGKLSSPNENQRKVPVKVREVKYVNDSRDPKVAEPVVSYGLEIVEEMVVSPGIDIAPRVMGGPIKIVDKRNPERVVRREYTRSER